MPPGWAVDDLHPLAAGGQLEQVLPVGRVVGKGEHVQLVAPLGQGHQLVPRPQAVALKRRPRKAGQGHKQLHGATHRKKSR